jgi:potassium efflux system protein
MFRITRAIPLLALCLLLYTGVMGQHKIIPDTSKGRISVDTSKERIPADSNHPKFMDRLKKMGRESATKSALKLREDKISISQNELLDQIENTIGDSKAYLKKSIDTGAVNLKLRQIEEWYDQISDGVFVNQGSIQTHRNLNVSYKLMTELLDKVKEQKVKIDAFERNILGFRNRLDSMISDSTLYYFSSDSATAVVYFEKIRQAAREVKPTDSALQAALLSMSKSKAHINLSYAKLNYGIEQIENFEKQLADKAFDREVTNLNDTTIHRRPPAEILHFSYLKNTLLLRFYLENHSGKLWLMLAMILLSWYFLRSLKQMAIKNSNLEKIYAEQAVLHFPLLSAIMLVLLMLQFIFPSPPFILNCFFWIIPSICLTFIFRRFVTRYWMIGWVSLLLLFFLSCSDNLVLQASRPERWIMFGMSSAGVIIGALLLYQGHKHELRERSIRIFIGLLVLMELVAAIANFFGRYNFSKTVMVSGFYSVIIAIMFLWVVRLINEGLAMASLLYKKPEKKSLYLNFNKVGSKAPTIFYVCILIGWAMLVGRNFYLFKTITDPLQHLLFDERTLGSYTFTISNALLFFLIVTVSVVLARVISFFADDAHHSVLSGSSDRKGGIGSWLLLIRITVISLGLFLAIAATGVPLDKLTIILGALSVGVGLGLQSLVNNLVSGLIIAFEKPLNVGDIIEINGQSGVIKAINFRSSILGTIDGADIIIPNGSLLNAQLINWTMSSSMRRSELVVGVGYNSDLGLVEKILKQLMNAQDDILKTPPPTVLFSQFGGSSIDVRMLFWVSHFAEVQVTKSKLITAVHVGFKENGIEIPFPQQEIRISNIESTQAEISNNEEK